MIEYNGRQYDKESFEAGRESLQEDLRTMLEHVLNGCSNHNCIALDNKVGTNGSCMCLVNASRTQLTIINGQLKRIGDFSEYRAKKFDD